MPKREERDLYSHAFDSNPYEGSDPSDMYRSLRWGNEPTQEFNIEAGESMASIGDLARLDTEHGSYEFDEEVAPFLAIGQDSNFLYVIPKEIMQENPSPEIPEFDPSSPEWEDNGEVSETHYYSDKGEEDAYYYHEHQNPLPSLWTHESGVSVLIPADNEGDPSYAVAKEGIIG